MTKAMPDNAALTAEATALTRELLFVVTSRTEYAAVAMDALASACMNVAHGAGTLHYIPRLARTMAGHPAVLQACEASRASTMPHSDAAVSSSGHAPEPTPEELDEANRLSQRAQELMREASSPSQALNALFTAYLNTAAEAGALDVVPAAGIALGAAARAMKAAQDDALNGRPIAPSKLH